MLSPVTQKQFDRLKERYSAAEILPLPSGAALITVPDIPLPEGWSMPATTVRFIVPSGYPGPAPDCFWADQALKLASGGDPQASNIQGIPEVGGTGRWFSWHVTEANNNWNPNRDDLLTFFTIIRDRFAHVQ